MAEQDYQKQIDGLSESIEILKNKIKQLDSNPKISDHFHNGFDVSKVKFQDLDTIYFLQTTVNPSNLVDGAGETIQITGVNGANLGDWVLISAPYDLQDITVTAYVQAVGVIEIRIQNESGATVNLDSGIWRILIIKKMI